MRFIKLSKQDFKNLLTNPTVMVGFLVYPVVLILLFGFLFSSLYESGGVTSYDYYGVTMILFTILLAASVTPNTFMEDRIKQGNLRIAYSPVRRWEVYASKILSSYLFTGILIIMDVLLLNALGIVNYGGENLLYIITLLLSLLLFAITLGGALCMIIRNENVTNTVISMVCNIIALGSGIFFPIDGLGQGLAKISNLSPMKWVVDSVFEVIYDGSFQNYGFTIMILIGLSLIFMLIVNFRYRPEDFI